SCTPESDYSAAITSPSDPRMTACVARPSSALGYSVAASRKGSIFEVDNDYPFGSAGFVDAWGSPEINALQRTRLESSRERGGLPFLAGPIGSSDPQPTSVAVTTNAPTRCFTSGWRVSLPETRLGSRHSDLSLGAATLRVAAPPPRPFFFPA